MLTVWWARTAPIRRTLFVPFVKFLLGQISLKIEDASLSVFASEYTPVRDTIGCHKGNGVEMVCQVGCVAVQPTTSKGRGGEEKCTGLQLRTDISGVGVTCVSTAGGTRDSGKLLQQWRVTVQTHVQLKWQQRREWYLCCNSNIDMKSLMFHCNGAIFSTLKTVSSLLNQHNQLSPYQPYRPCVPVSSNPRAWWRYAGRSILMHVCSLRNEPKWPVHQLCKLPSFVAWQKHGRNKGSPYCNICCEQCVCVTIGMEFVTTCRL